jgi:hypothetical protein
MRSIVVTPPLPKTVIVAVPADRPLTYSEAPETLTVATFVLLDVAEKPFV